MNPFEPANLSPIRKTPRACALPYGLTWDDLQAGLPDFDEHRAGEAQAFSSYEKQGLNGGDNSCMITLHYPTRGNQLRSETVFIKRNRDPEKKEAQKYQFSASHGIPTPRLLATLHKNDTEIIVLEFLPKIGIDFHVSTEVLSLLQLVALVNAIQNPPDLFKPQGGVPQTEFDERVRRALTEGARAPILPVALDIPRWFDAYQVAQKACRAMPMAVNHNEFYFQQVGWTQKNELVIFDLETMSLRPRFTDIAGILNPLAMYTGQNQLELFKIYFDSVSELNGFTLGIDEAFHELRLVRARDAFDSLPWRVETAKNTETAGLFDTSLPDAINNLHKDLLTLGLL